MNPNLPAHKLIRRTALEFASVVYGELMRGNEKYASWKKITPELTPEMREREWCRLAWPCFIKQARATLAGMLTQPSYRHLHNDIHEALIKDNELRAGGITTRLIQ